MKPLPRRKDNRTWKSRNNRSKDKIIKELYTEEMIENS